MSLDQPGHRTAPSTSRIEKDEILERIGFRGDPVANPKNIVSMGGARFTVLTPRLLRLEWSEVGLWEDRATFAFPVRNGPAQAYETWLEGDVLRPQQLRAAAPLPARRPVQRREPVDLFRS